MKQYLIAGATAILILSSCGGKKDNAAILKEKKEALEKLKSKKTDIDGEVTKLEKEISKLDTSATNAQKPKLVAIKPLALADFTHYIELQGRVDAENVSYITPRGAAGQVKEIYVKQGDNVRKGQLLLRLDDVVAQQNVTAARQGLESIRTQLALQKDLYQRQKNLWDQKIGTEVQLISVKSKVTELENQLQASQENVKSVQEQARTAQVTSDVDGVADLVTIKRGEVFGAAGSGVIKIVNSSVLKVTSNIPENYLGSVGKGTAVVVEMPDVNKTFNTTLSFVGASIDAINRGFVVEAKLPSDPVLKPNQIALLKIKDYGAANVIAVPLNTLQNDEKGKYVLVASTENGKLIARKKVVTIGLLSGDLVEIKSGLQAGDVLITEGFGSLYEGQLLTTK